MSYNSKFYAEAFCEAIKEGNEDRCITNLLTLVKNKKKLLAIFSIIERRLSRKVLIESARKLSEKNEKLVKTIIKPDDNVEKKIDSKLIAGLKVTINDELLYDGSLSTKLKKLWLTK